MAIPSVTYSFSNGSVASAPDVNTNFQDILNAISDGTGDLSFNTLTLTSTLTANGNVTLGNAAGDTLTVNATPTFVAATTFSSTTTFNGAATFNGDVNIGDASGDTITVDGTTTFNEAVTVTTGRLLTEDNGGFQIHTTAGDAIARWTVGGTAASPTQQWNAYCDTSDSQKWKLEDITNANTVITVDTDGNVGIGGAVQSSSISLQTKPAVGETGFYAYGATIANNQSIESFKLGTTAVGTIGTFGCINKSGFNESAYIYLRAIDAGNDWIYVDGIDRLMITNNSSNVGTSSGTVVGSQTSDERLKFNIEPIPYGLKEVLKLKPIKYEMFGKTDIGFGAQTTQPIIPESVYSTGDLIDKNDENSPADKLAMEYIRIIPVLTKAIQEQQAQIDSLKARLDALESA